MQYQDSILCRGVPKDAWASLELVILILSCIGNELRHLFMFISDFVSILFYGMALLTDPHVTTPWHWKFGTARYGLPRFIAGINELFITRENLCCLHLRHWLTCCLSGTGWMWHAWIAGVPRRRGKKLDNDVVQNHPYPPDPFHSFIGVCHSYKMDYW